MTIPLRGQTGHGTYFISADCWMKKRMLQSERSALLFIEMLYHYRKQGHYSVHEFVVMPHHFHLLITPGRATLEKSMQFIKGGFSFQVGKRFGYHGEIWQTSFYDRRVRDLVEYEAMKEYIHQNPVKASLVNRAEDWPYSSACARFELDPVPQRLKPED